MKWVYSAPLSTNNTSQNFVGSSICKWENFHCGTYSVNVSRICLITKEKMCLILPQPKSSPFPLLRLALKTTINLKEVAPMQGGQNTPFEGKAEVVILR